MTKSLSFNQGRRLQLYNVWLIRQFILINYNRRGFEGPTYKNIEFNVVVDRNFTQNKSEYQNN